MANFYTDAHIAVEIVDALVARGHEVVRCQAAGMKDARDFEHLLYASTNHLMLITHDRDFEELNLVWNGWSGAWGVAARHSGILRVPNRSVLPFVITVGAIDRFASDSPVLTNRCVRLLSSRQWMEALLPEKR